MTSLSRRTLALIRERFMAPRGEDEAPQRSGRARTLLLDALRLGELRPGELRPGERGSRGDDPRRARGEGRDSLLPEDCFVHPLAVVDRGASVGGGSKIWHFSHVQAGACIGERCVLGQNVNVASGVRIGNDVKIQNNVSVYAGTEIEDHVFLGPSAVLTNVTNPRAEVDRRALFETTRIRRGATIGANATIVCGITLGRYCFIAAGAVVTRDVPDYALMIGNPARQRGWMSRHGHRLEPSAGGELVCPESGLRYRERAPGVLCCLDLDEEAPLPEAQRIGKKTYDQRKPARGS